MPEVPLNGSNPLNVDPPETVTDFVGNFNSSAFMYLEEVEDYVVLLQDIQDTNALGEQFINLVRMIAMCVCMYGYSTCRLTSS